MKQDELFVITINRELGSGGRTIGRKLAERLGVPFYDKSVIQQLKKKYNLTADEIERLKGQKHNWWAEFKRSMMMMPNFVAPQVLPDYSSMPDFLITDEIFKAETEILKGIAADGSCVIAGRSGFYIFRDHPNHLSILIQASMDYRIKRVMEKQKISAEEAKSIIDKVDESRENYVKKYTGSSRYDTRNYDLVINADEHAEDEVVEMIIHYLKLPLSKIIF
jgi:cytidylate kinase